MLYVPSFEAGTRVLATIFQKSPFHSIRVTETATKGTPEAPAWIQVGKSGGTIFALVEPLRGTLCYGKALQNTDLQ